MYISLLFCCLYRTQSPDRVVLRQHYWILKALIFEESGISVGNDGWSKKSKSKTPQKQPKYFVCCLYLTQSPIMLC